MGKSNLLNFTAAASSIGVYPEKFKYYVKTGLIPVAKTENGRRFFDPEALSTFKFVDKRFSNKPKKIKRVGRGKKELTPDQLLAIRKRIRAGEKLYQIAPDTGMSMSTLALRLAEDAMSK